MRFKTGILVLGLAWACAAPAGVQAASFDCNKAKEADEIAVCDSRQLSQLDVKMATLYDTVTKLVAMGQRGDIQDQQRAFLVDREACSSNTACIRKLYDARIKTLQDAIDEVAKGGPY